MSCFTFCDVAAVADVDAVDSNSHIYEEVHSLANDALSLMIILNGTT